MGNWRRGNCDGKWRKEVEEKWKAKTREKGGSEEMVNNSSIIL